MWPNPIKKGQIPARKPMGLHNKCKKIDETQWVRRLQKRILDLGFFCPSEFSGL